MRYAGPLYRALNPVYARDPLSGEGAKRHGGRFNPKGMAALYTSLAIVTALKEAHQAGHLQPTTLVSYEASFERVFDGRDRTALQAYGLDPEALATPDWRTEMRAHGVSKTQAFASDIASEGYDALLVPSHAPGATASDLNLVLFRWADHPDRHLSVIDDEDRLGRM